ncbi:MAG: hypothetical protein JWM68_3611 [Verrucomicrobiales bacterium]|nr:hypothetical protein [Verrucomicrobiales bacterium]
MVIRQAKAAASELRENAREKDSSNKLLAT